MTGTVQPAEFSHVVAEFATLAALAARKALRCALLADQPALIGR